MATRKTVSKPALKSVKAKVSKAALPKKVASRSAPKPQTSSVAKEAKPVVTAPMKQKIKLVRDSFTIPKNEYLTLSDLKLRSARLGLPAKKSEILRAGVAVLSKMSDTEFAVALDAIPSLKTGRPKSPKKADAKKTEKKHKENRNKLRKN